MAFSPSQDRAECARRPRVRDLRPQRALAARLHRAAGRLAQEREVGVQPVAVLALDPAEPVAGGLHLLAVVEHDR